jgi:hypothetical protein
VFEPCDGEVFADEIVLAAGPDMQDADVLSAKLPLRFRTVENVLLVPLVGQADAATEERVDDQVAARLLAAEAAVATRVGAGGREVEERFAVEDRVRRTPASESWQMTPR